MSRVLVFLIVLTMVTPALAAEWTIARLRGEALILVGGGWEAASVGDILSSGATVRTGADGRMSLARGKETVELSASTEVRLFDEGEQRMTALMQKSGTITADVERRNVQHFSVQTPFMAAVVKGTRFAVRVGAAAATVEVFRGTVQVQDHVHNQFVDITPGQQASVSPTSTLAVEGARKPVVYTMDAVPVPVIAAPTAQDARADKADNRRNNNHRQERQDTNRGNGRDKSNSDGNDQGHENGNGKSHENGNSKDHGNSSSHGNNGNGNGRDNGSDRSNSGNNGQGNDNSGSSSNGNSHGNDNSNSSGNSNSQGNNGNANGQSGNQGNGNGQGNNGNGRGNG